MRKRLLIGLVLAALMVMVLPATAMAGRAVRSHEVPTGACGPCIDADGQAWLTRTDNGLTMQVHATGLEPGAAYTVWWIVDDGDGSFFVQNASGGLVGGTGEARFSGHVSVGDIADADGVVVLANVGDGSFDDPMGATVTLHVVTHGVVAPADIPENISTILGATGLSLEFVLAP